MESMSSHASPYFSSSHSNKLFFFSFFILLSNGAYISIFRLALVYIFAKFLDIVLIYFNAPQKKITDVGVVLNYISSAIKGLTDLATNTRVNYA